MPDESLWALTERYRGRFDAPPLSYGTVRDYADSAEALPRLATLGQSTARTIDMKNLQRCWALKAILGGVEPGSRVVEIGAGEPLVAGTLARMGYDVTVVDPYDGSGNGPIEYRSFVRAYPGVRFVRGTFPPAEPIAGPVRCVYSISVLEHVPVEQVGPLVEAGQDLVAPHGGCSIHAVDHALAGWGADEYAEKLTYCLRLLLLDHVEDLPLGAQPKLLRLVAEGVYVPLGGREQRADSRFLTIGGEDLPERVRRGAFRDDLFYRLEVLAFRVPPLRERPEDLPGLLERLLADLAERFERPGAALTDRAREWMLRHPWPGNLRQLRNVLERELILAGETGGAARLDPAPPAGAGAPPRPLVAVEAEEIRRALAYTRGHQGRAAELLGISRKALWEKRKRYGLP